MWQRVGGQAATTMASKKPNPAESPTKDVTHARANVAQKKKRTGHGGTVESRIAHIEGLMRELKFVTGKTVKQLAVTWGLSRERVAIYAAEASKRVRASVIDDRDRVGAAVGVALEKALKEAIAEKQWRVVANISDTWAKISGAGAASRSEISGRDGGPVISATVDLGSLSTEQLRRVAAGDLTALAGSGGAGTPTPGDGGSDPAGT